MSLARPFDQDMGQDSDVDLLVSFDPEVKVSLFDIMGLEVELEQLFMRPVDIVEPQALGNPIRRKNILASREPLYAAGDPRRSRAARFD